MFEEITVLEVKDRTRTNFFPAGLSEIFFTNEAIFGSKREHMRFSSHILAVYQLRVCSGGLDCSYMTLEGLEVSVSYVFSTLGLSEAHRRG